MNRIKSPFESYSFHDDTAEASFEFTNKEMKPWLSPLCPKKKINYMLTLSQRLSFKDIKKFLVNPEMKIKPNNETTYHRKDLFPQKTASNIYKLKFKKVSFQDETKEGKIRNESILQCYKNPRLLKECNSI